MSKPRWVAISAIGVLFSAAAAISAQSGKTAAENAASPPAERRAFLQRQEQRRAEIVDGLEFSARAAEPPSPMPQVCLLPPQISETAIDPHRSLFIHDRATLEARDFSLRRTLQQLANQVALRVPGTTPHSIFRQLWDTQNAVPQVTVPSSPHCSDTGTVNGYPIQCPRPEGMEAQGQDADIDYRIDTHYRVLALVNRFDLAHQGWRNCGEYRIIYAKGGGEHPSNFVIFEAVLPNPKPGCREACLPIAHFWTSLSGIDDLPTRAQMLETFYYFGLPGFRPVVHVDHYSATGVSGGYGSSGSGQIRTNQFVQGPWTLKEFKTVIDCAGTPCTFTIVPIMVKMNPYPPLWNELSGESNGPNFRGDVVAQLNRLSSSDLMQIGYEVDLNHDDGESVQQQTDNYRTQITPAGNLEALLGAGSLTAGQVANRALAQSCHGCHQPAGFGLTASASIGAATTPSGGTITSWPDTLGFFHVAPSITFIGPGQLGHELSPALTQHFLPHRLNFLVGQLNATRCTCPRRFRFVPPNERQRALEIAAKLDARFVTRMEQIARKSEDLGADRLQLLEGRDRILAERDRLLAGELAKAGIELPDDEILKSGPGALKLSASPAERTKAVHDLLRREPPRRTVTGSFRPH